MKIDEIYPNTCCCKFWTIKLNQNSLKKFHTFYTCQIVRSFPKKLSWSSNPYLFKCEHIKTIENKIGRAHQIFNISKEIRTHCFSCCNELPSHHQVAVDMDRAAKSWGFQRRFLRKGFRVFSLASNASKLEHGALPSVAENWGSLKCPGVTLKKGVYISTSQEGYPWSKKSFLDYQNSLPKAIPLTG